MDWVNWKDYPRSSMLIGESDEAVYAIIDWVAHGYRHRETGNTYATLAGAKRHVMFVVLKEKRSKWHSARVKRRSAFGMA